MEKDKKKQDNRFELRDPLRSYLKAIRNLAGGDACSLYLIEKNMDEEEKRESFEKRFRDVIKLNNGEEIKKEDIKKYDVLKFIGVADDKDDKKTGDSFWKFDYKNRPDKYIVIHNSSQKVIEGECITGMIARKRKFLKILNREEIENHPSRKRVKEKGDTERKVHPQCLALVGIPIIKQKNIFGVLRIDLYEKEKFEAEFISKISQETMFYLDRITQLIVDQSTKDASKKSYKELYKGTKILEALKELNKNQSITSQNKVILKAITHLFFVFQRHTYIGHDEILKMVLYFIEDLGDGLELNLPFTTLLEQFKDQEKLMLYDIEEYRDHFMHQFHVFVLGYIILNCIGIATVSGKINDRLKKIGIKGVEINENNILRIWTLIAFFHDICYLFQEYKIGIEKFIKDILKKDIPVNFNWQKVIQSPTSRKDKKIQPDYADCLKKLSEFFVSIKIKNGNTSQNQLLTNYYEAILSYQDHGIFSSLYLIENLLSRNNLVKKHVFVEAYFAGLAISLHNSCVFSGLGEGNELKISFESFPLEFILIYCDILAEWGRERRVKEDKEIISLKGPELEDFKYDSNEKIFTGVLNYKETPHFARRDIDEKIKKSKSVFNAQEFKFQIECKFFEEPNIIEKFW